jgi:hypothetical protein
MASAGPESPLALRTLISAVRRWRGLTHSPTRSSLQYALLVAPPVFLVEW